MAESDSHEGNRRERVVVAIDPGQHKCGLAVVTPTGPLVRAVVNTDGVAPRAVQLARTYQAAAIVVGSRTGARAVKAALTQEGPTVPVVWLEEDMTTILARQRYWRETPPGCLLRLVPEGMRVPPVPVDDWAAVVLGEKYLRLQEEEQ